MRSEALYRKWGPTNHPDPVEQSKMEGYLYHPWEEAQTLKTFRFLVPFLASLLHHPYRRYAYRLSRIYRNYSIRTLEVSKFVRQVIVPL